MNIYKFKLQNEQELDLKKIYIFLYSVMAVFENDEAEK